MLEDIKLHRRNFVSNLQKSFNCDLSKGVAAIGEIRHWNNGDYKKVGNGEWVKVTDKKDKRVAVSTVIKSIKAAIDYNQSKIDEFKRNFEDNFVSEYERGTRFYAMFFRKAWQNEIKENEFISNIVKEQEDFEDEIKEIKDKIKADEKRERESLAGKREIDADDVKPILEENSDLLSKVGKSIPMYLTAKEVLPEVTIDDYYLNTSVKFKGISPKKDGRETVGEKWKAMKNSNKYDWHKSPKSSSEYLIDKKTGDIFRFADHWGEVASCTWEIDSKNPRGFSIAKANIKDFSRKDVESYFNPKYRDAVVKSAEIILSNMKKLVSDNKEFYLTNDANKKIRTFVDRISDGLKYTARLSIKEINELKKKYEFV